MDLLWFAIGLSAVCFAVLMGVFWIGSKADERDQEIWDKMFDENETRKDWLKRLNDE